MPEDNPYAAYETVAPSTEHGEVKSSNPYAAYETVKPPAAPVTKPQSQADIDRTMGSQSTLGQMFQNRPEHLAPLSEVIDTGKREGTAAVQSLIQMPKAVAQGAYEDVKGGHVPLIHSMITEPVKN